MAEGVGKTLLLGELVAVVRDASKISLEGIADEEGLVLPK